MLARYPIPNTTKK
jgi:hypothetical protein